MYTKNMQFIEKKNHNRYLVAPLRVFITTLILSDMDYSNLKKYSLFKGFQITLMAIKSSLSNGAIIFSAMDFSNFKKYY